MRKRSVFVFVIICMLPWFALAESTDVSAFKAAAYQDYVQLHQGPVPAGSIAIHCASDAAGDGFTVIPGFWEVTDDCLLLLENGRVDFRVDVPQDGLYSMLIHYALGEEGIGAFAVSIAVDGELPFEEAREITLARLFEDEGEQKTDSRGNDIRRRQRSVAYWQARWVYDSQGYIEQPLQFYLTKGTHTLSFQSLRDNAVLHTIELKAYPAVPSYAQVYAQYIENDYRQVEQALVIQAEMPLYKSSATLQAFNDRASSSVTPYRGAKIVMNAIGSDSWKVVGQEIVWSFNAPEDGLYAISFKGKQNISAGRPSYRDLLIDGELPFAEAKDLSFTYSLRWQNYTFADEAGQPYLIYLARGAHTIALRASLGQTAQILKELNQSLMLLNDAYRKIITITGTTPDVYRDYDLDVTLPDVIAVFESEAERLTGLTNALVGITGVKGEESALIERAATQLASFADKPRTIAKRLDIYKSNLSGLATLMQSLSQQYLTLDSITLGNVASLPPAEAGFFDGLVHAATIFLASFSEDYNTIGEPADDGDVLTVWVSTGRDQAEVIRRLLDESFTSQYGVSVDLKLVPSGVLLSATLANLNPDVVLQLGAADPVNYAMRGALVDLSQFDDFAQVSERFIDAATVPFAYRGGVYALPETMSFPLMFYRKDIFDELGLKVPRNWDEFYQVLGELQRNNLEIGLPYTVVSNYGYGTLNGGMQTYVMFLSQLNGTLYADGGTRSNITSPEGVEAFRIWTNLYGNYQLPLTYDFANRFRRGEMPLAIADYTTYNLLQVLAPEIQGLWGFTVVPGMADAQGNINNSVPFTSSACSIMKNNNDRVQDSWEFLKWWTSADTQLSFALEMENRLGPSARYAAANLETLSNIPWSSAEYAVISEQMKSLVAVEEVPGGYFTPRHIDNAFRAVVYSGEDAFDTLLDYVRYIDDELQAKQAEFGD